MEYEKWYLFYSENESFSELTYRMEESLDMKSLKLHQFGAEMEFPSVFGFVSLPAGYDEKELEDALEQNITRFLLELGSGFDPELTGRENIYLNGAILGYSKEFLESKYDEIVAFSELGEFINMPIRNYSSGMMMRLAFSVATVVCPEILIVDEILAVGDEGFQNKSKARMLELMGGGTTVLFVSHSIDQIEEMCDRVVWLDQHKVKMIGDAHEVCQLYREYWK